MNFWQGCVNVLKKAELRGETKTKERMVEKNCEIGVFGGTSDVHIQRNSLGFHFETRNLVLSNYRKTFCVD